MDQVDDYHFKHYYNTSVFLLNSGGYTLVTGWVFDFGLALLSALRNASTMEKMNRDPKNSFTAAKKNIMENNEVKVSFQEVCISKACITDEKRINAAIEMVYKIFLTKVLHCRFVPIICRWVEKNVNISRRIEGNNIP